MPRLLGANVSIRYVASFILVLGLIGSAGLADDAVDASRRLEYELDTIESRARAKPVPKLSDRSVGSDLSVSRQRLRTLKTTNPNARSTPLLERQLHRVDRSRRARRR
jgi:hypothetical protein